MHHGIDSREDLAQVSNRRANRTLKKAGLSRGSGPFSVIPAKAGNQVCSNPIVSFLIHEGCPTVLITMTGRESFEPGFFIESKASRWYKRTGFGDRENGMNLAS
jgi:hypothetical protein